MPSETIVNFKMFSFSLMLLICDFMVINAWKTMKVGNEELVLAQEGEELRLDFRQDIALSYCWFSHPDGTQFHANYNPKDDSNYWNERDGLLGGDCSLTIKQATRNDTGVWTSHSGATVSGLETTQHKKVIVGGAITALNHNITAEYGKSVSLTCTMSADRTPLSYCRFVTPNGISFGITPDFTANNSIHNNYHFAEDFYTMYGDCAITIKKATFEDSGLWTCVAMPDGHHREVMDTIHLLVTEEPPIITTASITGITFGVTTLFITISVCAFILWQKYVVKRSDRAGHEQNIEIHELNRGQGDVAGPSDHVGGANDGMPEVVINSPSEASSPV